MFHYKNKIIYGLIILIEDRQNELLKLGKAIKSTNNAFLQTTKFDTFTFKS